jgi:signal transduction histidine kinase
MSVYLAFSELEKSKNNMQTILDSIGDAVFVLNTSSKIVLLNPAAMRYLSIHSKNPIGILYTSFFSFRYETNPEKPFPDFVNEVLHSGKTYYSEQKTSLKCEKGVEPVGFTASPIQNFINQTIGVVVVIRSMKKEREFEQQKDDFISTAAHQLRTPLGAMRWNIELMLHEKKISLSKPTQQTLRQIYENVLRMIEIVNDMLQVSRIDQNHAVFLTKETNIADSISKAVETFSTQIKTKHISCVFFKPKKTFTIMIDPDKLFDVFENILSNAVKYNPVKGSITISFEERINHIDVSVTDTGIGIKEEELTKIFHKFYRASNARTVAADGTGLGLFVAESYMKRWGGSISVDSKIGKGSTFTLHIPKKPKNS